MSTASNKRLVQKYYEDIVSTGCIDDIARYVSADYVEVHDGVEYPIGLEGAKEHVLGVRKTYPDLRLTVERQIAEGDWVVTMVTMHGTHLGEWLGMKPTGRPVEMTAVNVDKVNDDRIVEHGGAANLLGPLLKIGAVRVVGEDGA